MVSVKLCQSSMAVFFQFLAIASSLARVTNVNPNLGLADVAKDAQQQLIQCGPRLDE